MKYVTYSGVSLFNIFLFFPPGPFADKGLELLIYSFASNFKVAELLFYTNAFCAFSIS